MLAHYDQFRNDLPLNILDDWIGNLNGWREIDTTCQSNYTAKDILLNWEEWHPFLVDLSQRDTIQHRRASLVLLVKPLLDSEDERFILTALGNVESLKHEKDKLITKAVSWILRSSVKRHRQIVGEYVFKNEASLPAIALREFKKKYTTGKK
jgi:3-methyladenine DNA glycosylase AlkD